MIYLATIDRSCVRILYLISPLPPPTPTSTIHTPIYTYIHIHRKQSFFCLHVARAKCVKKSQIHINPETPFSEPTWDARSLTQIQPVFCSTLLMILKCSLRYLMVQVQYMMSNDRQQFKKTYQLLKSKCFKTNRWLTLKCSVSYKKNRNIII